MQEAVWWDPREVHIALARLGLSVAPLLEAVRAGHVSRISRTLNDAPIAHGFYQWNDTLRALREHLVAVGWHRNNDNGLPTTVNPNGTIAICVSSGNESTGIPSETPSTKHTKGPCTEVYVTSNATQIALFPNLPAPAPVRSSRDGSNIATWTLLFHNDIQEIRSELSLPVFIESGQIVGWKERIILPVIPFDGDAYRKTFEPDFGPDVDIDIRRRA